MGTRMLPRSQSIRHSTLYAWLSPEKSRRTGTSPMRRRTSSAMSTDAPPRPSIQRAGSTSRAGDLIRLRPGENRRLLAQHRLAGPQRPAAPSDMQAVRQRYVHSVHVVIQQQALMRFPSIIVCARMALAHVNAMLYSESGESLRVSAGNRNKLSALDACERRDKALGDRTGAQNTPANTFHKVSRRFNAHACHDTRPQQSPPSPPLHHRKGGGPHKPYVASDRSA